MLSRLDRFIIYNLQLFKFPTSLEPFQNYLNLIIKISHYQTFWWNYNELHFEFWLKFYLWPVQKYKSTRLQKVGPIRTGNGRFVFNFCFSWKKKCEQMNRNFQNNSRALISILSTNLWFDEFFLKFRHFFRQVFLDL